MIELHEIRIGNWFIGYDGKPFEWMVEHFGLLCKSGENTPFLDELIKEPIPLTEEILLKVNFEQEYKSEWTIKYTLISDSRFWFDYNINFGWRVRYMGEHFDHIKSLHQLMNFYYSLTGKEIIYSPN